MLWGSTTVERDSEFYRRRAEQEAARAAACKHPVARDAHERMREAYLERALTAHDVKGSGHQA
jgi:hypothetical protein